MGIAVGSDDREISKHAMSIVSAYFDLKPLALPKFEIVAVCNNPLARTLNC
ncbi:hypothetical protein [Chamaesiphon sp. VAR_48_metabat_403]|uniref:hypothetical protein n=1 Tax=Chamaesiphon sp. VAR_48_metabat_403 TaxID=2964700 RepID=UPI00286DAAF3|nr:hypothetical protein [Chamaesiphon sp. VAR_48_metabat_403]